MVQKLCAVQLGKPGTESSCRPEKEGVKSGGGCAIYLYTKKAWVPAYICMWPDTNMNEGRGEAMASTVDAKKEKKTALLRSYKKFKLHSCESCSKYVKKYVFF